MRILIQLLLLSFTLLFVGCQNSKKIVEPKLNLNLNPQNRAKQEKSHSHDWVESWNTCSGDIALKKDGSLWQFGKIDGCDWGEITPIDPNTGKPIYKEAYIYHLKGHKIGSGFRGAKIINGAVRLYAIKKDGTLWRWNNEQPTPKQLGKDNSWKDIGINIPIHDGLDFDIGLKKDGSLWEIYPSKIVPLVQSKGWKKVLVECCDIYAQQKNGKIKHIRTYFDELKNNKHVEEIKPAKEHFNSASEYRKFLTKFSKLEDGVVKGATYASRAKQAKEDGTLWLMPQIITKEGTINETKKIN